MKLRIQDNSIRFRLSQSEVTNFGIDGAVMGKVEFPGGNTLVYRLTQAPILSGNLINNIVTIALPEQKVQEWLNTDQVGIKGNLTLENEDNLSILVEKDFKCLTERGEDESDLFPNPKESH